MKWPSSYREVVSTKAPSSTIDEFTWTPRIPSVLFLIALMKLRNVCKKLVGNSDKMKFLPNCMSYFFMFFFIIIVGK